MRTDFLHAFFRENDDKQRKWTWTRLLFLCIFLFAFTTSKVNAQFTAATIDGNPQEWTQANINTIPIHSFIHDAFGNGVVDSQFTEGSKDFLFGADLRWTVSQTKAKNDIANAAALITDGKLFFAGDRTSNNGDAQIAFWFYLNGTAPHVRTDGVQDFAPEHAIGDLLILADFTGGGRSANVTVLKWVETGGNVPNTNGTLNTTNIVGIVAQNNAGAAAVPAGWIFTGNTFATNEFYEGVVDLAGLNLPSLCFSSFLLETRSSQSITASLDDFAAASFNAKPQPPTVTGAERCGVGELTLTASCNGSGVHWFTNAQGGNPLGQADGVSADGNSLTRNFNSTQTFFVSCFNAQINCESARVPVTGTVNPPATSNAGVDQTVCASDPSVTLAGIVGGSATTGTWSGGTGTFTPNANTLNAVYTPSAPEIAAGLVELTLTTNDPAGLCPPAIDKMQIFINPVATVNAGADQTVCASDPNVTLAGIVGGSATTGTWSGGTGTFTPNANTLNAVYTPSTTEIAAGSVELTLTTNDPAGPCPPAIDKVRIVINPVATVNAGADQTVCASDPNVTLAGIVGGSATSGTWSGGTGTFTPNANTLNAVYTPSAEEIAAGAVELTLTTNDPAGPCPPAIDKVKIFINPVATVNAGADQTACSASPTVTLAGIVGGSATTGTWSGGTGVFNPNANTLNATYTLSTAEIAAGFVELTLTTNDPEGPCPPVNDKVRITVTSDATVNAGPDQQVCASDPAVSLAGIVGGGATSGTWSGGTGTFSPNANTLNAVYTPSAAEIAAGFADLVLTTNDPEGPCNAATDAMRITIHPNPLISISVVSAAACAGDNAKLNLTVTGEASPFDIFLDGVQILNDIASFPVQISVPADNNNHTLKVVDTKGCESEATVNGGAAPAPIIFRLTAKAQTCLDINDGCILVEISGGTPPYKVQLNNGALVQLSANETSHQFCGLAPGAYTVHVTDANNCTVADQVVTVNEGPACAPLPTIGHCTYTQGQYGTFNGQACLPDGSSVIAQDIMVKALDAEPNDFRDFGVVANNKFFRLTLNDVAGGKEANIYKLLPGGGNACALKGFTTFAQVNTWGNVPLSTKPQTLGKILNTLLAQTITLYFNLSEDPTLGNETVQDTIITSKQTFCGSGIVQPGTEEKFGFPHPVVVFLNNSNDAFDYPNTVAGLFKLANDILGGVSVPVNCADVATAVDVFNNAFDGCRIQTGSIPFNDASSLIVNNGLQTGSTTLSQPTIETVNEVQIKAYPNPFSDKVNFQFVSPIKGKATLEIYNIFGQRIALLFSGMVDAGISKTVQYTKGRTVASTMLVYKLTVGDKVIQGKVQVMN
jgi:hypothetical protein